MRYARVCVRARSCAGVHVRMPGAYVACSCKLTTSCMPIKKDGLELLITLYDAHRLCLYHRHLILHVTTSSIIASDKSDHLPLYADLSHEAKLPTTSPASNYR